MSGRGCGLITALKDTAKFKMGKDSAITNLNLSIDFEQSLSMFHNIPLTGTGGYLSLQSIALLWPGATVSTADAGKTSLSQMSGNTDVAQKGWWMSFSDPINLGSVNPTDDIDIEPLFPQIAANVSNQLNATPANIGIGSLINAVGGLGGYINVSSNDIDLQHYPLNLSLSNLQLNGQNFKPNCYGGLKFC